MKIKIPLEALSKRELQKVKKLMESKNCDISNKKEIEIEIKNSNECDEEKLLLILSYLKKKRELEFFKIILYCMFFDKEYIRKRVKENIITVPEEKEIEEIIANSQKEFDYMCRFLKNPIFCKIQKVANNILTLKGLIENAKDNQITLEKILIFDLNTLKYLMKKPDLLYLIKKIPVDILKKMSENN